MLDSNQMLRRGSGDCDRWWVLGGVIAGEAGYLFS